MKPRGSLMIEHRLIEKMLAIIKNQAAVIDRQERIDPVFIDTVVDFIRIYADRTHHGKEEDIMFKELAAKSMNQEDKKVMQELMDEHIITRKVVADLVQAKTDYFDGNLTALNTIKDKLNILVELYPVHIEKEDKIFFPNTEKYLSDKEQEDMLIRFQEFDRNMIHDKYKSVVTSLWQNNINL